MIYYKPTFKITAAVFVFFFENSFFKNFAAMGYYMIRALCRYASQRKKLFGEFYNKEIKLQKFFYLTFKHLHMDLSWN